LRHDARQRYALGFLRELTDDYSIKSREIVWCAIAAVCAAAALVFLVGPIEALFGFYLTFTMLLITVVDARVMLIPDVLSVPSVPVGLIGAALTRQGDLTDVMWDHGIAALVAGLIFFALRVLYQKFRGIEGLGLGDVKLAMAAGAWVGLELLALTCLFATLSALTVVLIKQIGSADKPELKTAIPFGSFIAPAILAIWIVSALFG
jgi:leader peptidase (prepilin peptidase) / N-methyltransferase